MSGRNESQPAPLVEWRHKLLDDKLRLKRKKGSPRTLSWRAKTVALGLSAYWDGNGTGAFTGVEKLAKRLGVSERTVQRGLRELEERGVIKGVVRKGRTTIYHAKGVAHSHPSADTPDSQSPRGDSQTPTPDSQSPRGDSQTPEVALEPVTQGVTEGVEAFHASLEEARKRPPRPLKVCPECSVGRGLHTADCSLGKAA